MIYSTIEQKGFELSVDNEKLPLQYSNDLTFKFVKDPAYTDYAVIPYVAITDTKMLSCAKKFNLQALPFQSDGTFQIANHIMNHDGYMVIAFDLTNAEETIHIGNVIYKVEASIGGVEVLPERTEEWQAIVRTFMEQYVTLNITPHLRELITTVDGLITTSQMQQEAVNRLVSMIQHKLDNNEFIPAHKWEGTVLYFANPDGSWDEGVNLAMSDGSVTDEKIADHTISESKLAFDVVKPGDFESSNNYIKLPDGTLMCYGFTVIEENKMYVTITMPVTFKFAPRVFLTPTYNYYREQFCLVSSVTNTSFRITSISSTGDSLKERNMYWFAIGRWK